MPDYSAEIAKLESLVNNATRSVSVDGTSAQIDLEQARKRLAELRTLQGGANARPAISRINLGGAW